MPIEPSKVESARVQEVQDGIRAQPADAWTGIADVGGVKNDECHAVAVGTVIADRPPHRSVRAELPHTAPTSDVWRQNVRRRCRSFLMA
jgi:hypothetical protein